MNYPDTDSLPRIADRLVKYVCNLRLHVTTEEDLRIGFEKLLEPLLKSIGVTSNPKYEKSIFSGRSDALHGNVIIEYESPGSLKQKNRVDHAFNQLTDYISGEALERKEELFIYDPKLIGVGFDGEHIFFVQYTGDKTKEKTALEKKDFILSGPYLFDAESSRTFLTYLRALSRLPLTAENLADKFGPRSNVAPQSVSAFADALTNWGDEKVRVFFNEWKRLFGIVYGEKFSLHQVEEAKAFAFEIAWTQTIFKHNIGGLKYKLHSDLKPAENNLHNIAFNFVWQQLKEQEPLETVSYTHLTLPTN